MLPGRRRSESRSRGSSSSGGGPRHSSRSKAVSFAHISEASGRNSSTMHPSSSSSEQRESCGARRSGDVETASPAAGADSAPPAPQARRRPRCSGSPRGRASSATPTPTPPRVRRRPAADGGRAELIARRALLCHRSGRRRTGRGGGRGGGARFGAGRRRRRRRRRRTTPEGARRGRHPSIANPLRRGTSGRETRASATPS